MKLLSSTLLRAAAVAVALPLLGLSVTISPATFTYAINTSSSGTNSTTVDSGLFSLGATYGVGVNSGGGTYVVFDPTVTYVGSTPLTAPVTINYNLLENIYDSAATSWNGTYTENIPLSVAADSTVSAELLVDGQTLGAISNVGPGSSDTTMSATLSGLGGSTLSYAYDFTFYFAAGAAPGATDSSTPEPATMIPAALGLFGFGLMALRRRKK